MQSKRHERGRSRNGGLSSLIRGGGTQNNDDHHNNDDGKCDDRSDDYERDHLKSEEGGDSKQ